MKRNKQIRLLALIVATFAWPAMANSKCSTDEFRQFDFWLGNWQVINETTGAANSSNAASMSKISKILGGCSILEEYQTANGFRGKSLNIFNAQTQSWHQTWVDNSGLLLQLEGKFVDGVMVLMGEVIDKDGKAVEQKISWQALDNGDVRQIWAQRDIDGKWQVLFNGRYVKADVKNP
ncbi:hypothetical protein [Thalassotalea litorea]|uniref:hypothetical protein n=1 Tax=Thalassotalea litorea TaxID=2020715 RepID=UPI003736CBFF